MLRPFYGVVCVFLKYKKIGTSETCKARRARAPIKFAKQKSFWEKDGALSEAKRGEQRPCQNAPRARA